MKLDKLERDKAEGELIDLVRRNDTQNFTLCIACDRGRWTVTTEDHDTRAKGFGAGGSFTEAWRSLEPRWGRES